MNADNLHPHFSALILAALAVCLPADCPDLRCKHSLCQSIHEIWANSFGESLALPVKST